MQETHIPPLPAYTLTKREGKRKKIKQKHKTFSSERDEPRELRILEMLARCTKKGLN